MRVYKGKEILFGRALPLFGGVMSIISGGLANTFFRGLAGILSISANSTSWFAEKLFIDLDDPDRKPATTKIEKAKEWVAGQQIYISGAQRVLGSGSFALSGYLGDNLPEMSSGLVYLTAATLELKGEKGRGYWLSSTALSGAGASLVIAAGCKGGNFDPALIAGGTAYLAGAVSLALGRPEKYKNFRERIESEQKEVEEIER